MYEFVIERYPFDRRFHLEEDGSIFVEGLVLRRSEKQIALGVSQLDVDALKRRMDKADTRKEVTTELAALSGMRCVKRSVDKVLDRGRFHEQSWHLPLNEDVLLVFRVSFSWNRLAKDAKTRAIQSNVDALARAVFESLAVKFDATK